MGDFLLGPYELPPRLTGAGYLNFLQNQLDQLLMDALDDVPLAVRRRTWFMHDGAPPHFSVDVRQWLHRRFPYQWVGRGPDAPVPWPARSPDLNPVDFYLWGHMKELVYATPVETRDGLWQRVQKAADAVRNGPGVFERVRASTHRRAIACIRSGGKHFEHLL
ncbi:hypothetical protein X777_05723 [Ooceraea biroi]|uniref:Tc1-like transposase DDE domain-containing protein n=1 Tax=Ooceraea biroi TaxID=2015173 RepID=A0A026WEG5_OOCBI|nr:hypothetical protein X777_05723 [Ooceraea biroi]